MRISAASFALMLGSCRHLHESIRGKAIINRSSGAYRRTERSGSAHRMLQLVERMGARFLGRREVSKRSGLLTGPCGRLRGVGSIAGPSRFDPRSAVIAVLDTAIHHFKKSCELDGPAGQARGRRLSKSDRQRVNFSGTRLWRCRALGPQNCPIWTLATFQSLAPWADISVSARAGGVFAVLYLVRRSLRLGYSGDGFREGRGWQRR